MEELEVLLCEGFEVVEVECDPVVDESVDFGGGHGWF